MTRYNRGLRSLEETVDWLFLHFGKQVQEYSFSAFCWKEQAAMAVPDIAEEDKKDRLTSPENVPGYRSPG